MPIEEDISIYVHTRQSSSVRLTKHTIISMWRRVEVRLHAFFTLKLDADE